MRATQYFRYMARESRGSRGRLGFFIACLAVGVAAVVAVAGLSEGLETAVGREARQLMAADLAIEGRKPLPAEIESLLDARVGTNRALLKEMATVVAAVPRGSEDEAIGASQLVELKSVDGDYPFYGRLSLDPLRGRDEPLSELLGEDRVVVASDLLSRLKLEVGDRLRIGRQRFEIAGVVLSEPDRIGMALTMGPRVFVSGEGLARADLERFGSRISYRTLVKLPREMSREELSALAEEIRSWPELQNRFRVETYAEAQPAVRRALSRVDRFLGLVALLSLLLGGVGVAQTTRAWLSGRMDSMAVLRALGFRPNEVFLLYFGQTVALGLAGSLLGVVGGVGVLALTPALTADLLPEGLGIGLWQPFSFLRGIGLGLGTALLFSFAPLAAVRRVPPLRVLRKDVEPLRPSLWAHALTTLVLFTGVAATATIQAASVRYGLGFTAGVTLAAGALALVTLGAIRILGILPGDLLRAAPVWVRHGLAALLRPGAGTIGAVVALGLGVLLLLGIALVQSGLSGQLSTALPAGSPSAFLIDIQGSQWPGVQRILNEAGAESINSAPVVTARLESIGDLEVDALVEDTENRGRRWALTREQRVTYLEELAPDNEILERAAPGAGRSAGSGALWGDPERWELSVEEDYAGDLGLEVGTELVLDVQGVPIEFTVTSIRSVDWGTFDLNFFFVAEPAALEDAPQYRVATVRLPPGAEQRVQDRLAASYQNVTMLRIRDVLEKVGKVLDRLAFGVQFLGGFTVLAGLVILAGAVSANSIRRGREIALLKTLGMVRREVALMFSIEFALLGFLAGSMGAFGGVLLSHTVLTRGMAVAWTFEPLPVAIAVATSVALASAAAVLAGSRGL
ncbi:MAG: FtsX-like permease family protein, partial [bacterium]|nr:FtsX-like permease family protein [bacterium]